MKTIRLYHHPDCGRCARYARWHHRMDWLDRFEDSTETPPDGPLRVGEIAVTDLRTGQTIRGIASVRLLFRQIPAWWWMLPLTYFRPVRRRIERDLGECAGGACALPGRSA